MNTIHSLWLGTLQVQRSAALRLFAFPYAGGNAYAFRSWQAQLPEEVQLCPIQLPGRGRRLREKPYVSMDKLVRDLASALASHCDLPFAFFGHSMGGIIAYELARHLAERFGLEPDLLAISSCTAAHQLCYSRLLYDLPDQELIQELRSFGGSPPEVLGNHELMRVLLPVMRADLKLIQTYCYRPGALLHCLIHAFAGSDDSGDPAEKMARWAELTAGPFQLDVLSGGHFSVFSARQEFMERLKMTLKIANEPPHAPECPRPPKSPPAVRRGNREC